MNSPTSTYSSVLRPAHETSLFKALYALYLAWYLQCRSFPKKDRFTIGQKTEDIILETLSLFTAAYHSKDTEFKKHTQLYMSDKLESVKILVRLAKDVHAIEKQSYIEYEGRLQEIGKMLGGWIKDLQNHAS